MGIVCDAGWSDGRSVGFLDLKSLRSYSGIDTDNTGGRIDVTAHLNGCCSFLVFPHNLVFLRRRPPV